jgi:hypothetical protein
VKFASQDLEASAILVLLHVVILLLSTTNATGPRLATCLKNKALSEASVA